MTIITKECTKCRKTKPLDSFNKDKSRSDGNSNRCRTCSYEARRITIKKHKDKPCTNCGKGKRLKNQTVCSECNSRRCAMTSYNITEDEVKSLRAQTHCDACGRSKEEAATEKGFHIDHCHDGGHVRGVLCHYCNVALGMMRDDPIRIRKLEMYINRANYDEDTTGSHG